jgi:pyruvate-formate lyase
MMEGCLQTGRDVIQGGATYNSSGAAMIGLADVVDSLTAIEEFVFNRQKISAAELSEALQNDWEGPSQKHLIRVKNSREKFGTNSEMAMANARWLMDFVHRKFQEKENYRGGKYTVGYWTMTNHAGFGMLTKAMPNGRKAGEPFASGITPVSGSAPGLTSCLNFIAGLEHKKITNGQALNLKFLPKTASPESFAGYIKGYFEKGGIQVQFNVIDREKLLDACKPEKREEYKDLLVRVSGYTAYFVDLNDQMKKEVINRAEYDLATGQEVEYKPFKG